MSKDIRSYFSSSFKTVKKNGNKVTEEPIVSRKRKKNLIVLSDSDEEPVVKSPRKDKKNVPKTQKVVETSKYFELNKEEVRKRFGESPVKRKLALPKSNDKASVDKNGEFDDLLCGIEDEDGDVWEKTYISDHNTPKKMDIEAVSNKGDEVDAKKRKLNFNEQPVELEIKNKEKPVNFINLVDDDDDDGDDKGKHIENGRRNVEIENNLSPKKMTTPIKLKTPSPKKKFSPQKQNTPSPQKMITSYLSPKKKISSPRFNKLNLTLTPAKTDTIKKLNDICSDKSSEEKGIIQENKVSTNSDPLRVNCKPSEHTLSSDDDNSSKQSKTVSHTKLSPKISPVEHTISSDSDDEDLIKKKNSLQKSTIKTTEVKTKTIKPTKPFTTSVPLIKPKPSPNPYELWVEKYRPVSLKQIIGQQGEKSNVNKLLKWLKNWFANQSGSKKITRPSPWAKDDSGAYFKAALLSGPPGIGKTTTAHLVCKELKMDVVEFNASDTRSKKLLNLEISELLSTKSLSPFMQGGGGTSRQHVLLMDEVDGMAGNEDRGGIQELISLIKNTKIPIICMCNDRNHPKIRSLVNYCFDLRFNRPRVDQIKGAMLSICFKEKLKVKPDILTQIIASTNQDIRLVLNHLSILSAKKEENMNITNKEFKLGPWDVARKVFSHEEHKTMTIHDKSDLFFHDYGIAPLFVQENYLNVIPYSEKGKTKQGKMDLFSKTATSLCYGDMIDHAIRTQGAWSLLPTQAIFSSVIPGDTLSGRVGGMINFPSWLGKNSRKNKLDRLCQEIQMHTRLKASASKEAICTDYSYKLRDGVALPLVNLGSSGVDDSLQFLHEYDLLREDIESLTELTSWPNTKDPFSLLDSKVKAAFTRAYNKHPVMSPFSRSGTTALKKGRKGNSDDNEMEIITNVEASEELAINDGSDQEDDLLSDGMINIKNKIKPENSKKEQTKKEKTSSNKPRGGKKGKK